MSALLALLIRVQSAVQVLGHCLNAQLVFLCRRSIRAFFILKLFVQLLQLLLVARSLRLRRGVFTRSVTAAQVAYRLVTRLANLRGTLAEGSENFSDRRLGNESALVAKL